MDWNLLAETSIRGRTITVKDAMIMVGPDDDAADWSSVTVKPGEYVVELDLASPWHCARFRIREKGSNPTVGDALGPLSIDNAKAGIIDFENFQAAVQNDPDEYEEWTANELDDELAINFSGRIEFNGSPIFYVTAGDGDGTYAVFELVDDGRTVGLECRFDDPVRP